MRQNYLIILLLFIISNAPKAHAQESSIQFPHLDFHMGMNQNLAPSISYRAEANIVVGDKSGLIFSLGVNGEDLNLQSGLNDLIKLDTLKLTISPASFFNFHAFFGRHKYLGEDKVIPRGFQFNYTPGTDYYGYRTISGAGLAATFPIEEGRYEPEFMIYSDNNKGVDYLNFDFMTTFRFELWYLELYAGLAFPTIGSIDTQTRGRGGISIYTTIELVNIYFALYIPAHFEGTFTIDDIYFRLSQYLLINGFEQTFSIYSLGSESGNTTDPLIGFNGTPDLNIFLSLGGRISNIGFGFDYGFIYGLYQSEFLVNNSLHLSHRVGTYVDIGFLGLTYKVGVYYTLPNSVAYTQNNSSANEVGFYISIFGAS